MEDHSATSSAGRLQRRGISQQNLSFEQPKDVFRCAQAAGASAWKAS